MWCWSCCSAFHKFVAETDTWGGLSTPMSRVDVLLNRFESTVQLSRVTTCIKVTGHPCNQRLHIEDHCCVFHRSWRCTVLCLLDVLAGFHCNSAIWDNLIIISVDHHPMALHDKHRTTVVTSCHAQLERSQLGLISVVSNVEAIDAIATDTRTRQDVTTLENFQCVVNCSAMAQPFRIWQRCCRATLSVTH